LSTFKIWTTGGYLTGLTISVLINLFKINLYNVELSKTEIHGIIFLNTSLCFLRGFTGNSLLENIRLLLF
jgi:hypothetical protein